MPDEPVHVGAHGTTAPRYRKIGGGPGHQHGLKVTDDVLVTEPHTTPARSNNTGQVRGRGPSPAGYKGRNLQKAYRRTSASGRRNG